ncbi:hypothetical protein QN277_025411 [Acacia crassicarpa]|uniref:Uncharacterized protein n=1 Tax=Acacia crassicarpa TaxID=499986 RepID=A0AAE1ME99_9FABA|nr:hypothetical protein QN277_025411 [Acacia crassicarpa]
MAYNFWQLDPEFEADFVQGELRPDMVSEKACAHRKSNDDASDTTTTLSTSYAVSHHELSLRLHEVIQSRLEERVKELEIALESSQRKVQMMEPKLSGHYDEWDHPLVVNLSGEALDAYNEAYEELVKRDYTEENSQSGI